MFERKINLLKRRGNVEEDDVKVNVTLAPLLISTLRINQIKKGGSLIIYGVTVTKLDRMSKIKNIYLEID
jgi:hypothetical protein